MTLKFQLDSLEGVDESIQSLYVEKDGKFVLGIDGLPQQEDVTGLKAKVEELLGEKKAAEKARREAEEKARAEAEEAARKSGNVEELEKSWSEKYNRREAELSSALEKERNTLQSQMPYNTDGTHMTGDSYSRIGCMHTRAAEAIINNRTWKPTHAVSAVRAGSVIHVKFYTPFALCTSSSFSAV